MFYNLPENYSKEDFFKLLETADSYSWPGIEYLKDSKIAPEILRERRKEWKEFIQNHAPINALQPSSAQYLEFRLKKNNQLPAGARVVEIPPVLYELFYMHKVAIGEGEKIRELEIKDNQLALDEREQLSNCFFNDSKELLNDIHIKGILDKPIINQEILLKLKKNLLHYISSMQKPSTHLTAYMSEEIRKSFSEEYSKIQNNQPSLIDLVLEVELDALYKEKVLFWRVTGGVPFQLDMENTRLKELISLKIGDAFSSNAGFRMALDCAWTYINQEKEFKEAIECFKGETTGSICEKTPLKEKIAKYVRYYNASSATHLYQSVNDRDFSLFRVILDKIMEKQNLNSLRELLLEAKKFPRVKEYAGNITNKRLMHIYSDTLSDFPLKENYFGQLGGQALLKKVILDVFSAKPSTVELADFSYGYSLFSGFFHDGGNWGSVSACVYVYTLNNKGYTYFLAVDKKDLLDSIMFMPDTPMRWGILQQGEKFHPKLKSNPQSGENNLILPRIGWKGHENLYKILMHCEKIFKFLEKTEIIQYDERLIAKNLEDLLNLYKIPRDQLSEDQKVILKAKENLGLAIFLVRWLINQADVHTELKQRLPEDKDPKTVLQPKSAPPKKVFKPYFRGSETITINEN